SRAFSYLHHFSLLPPRLPPSSTLFPYTTLFRSVFVDGQYNQDIFLFAGGRAFAYQVLLGHFQPGEHTLRVDFNRKRSAAKATEIDRKSTRLNSSHVSISYAVFCLKKKKIKK